MSDFEDKLNSILSSPKDMEKILGLARELGGSSAVRDEGQSSPRSRSENDDFSFPKDIDPKFLKIAGRLMSAYSSAGNDKSDLMRSLKPYVRSERRRDLDKAAEIAKLAKLAKIAFAEFSGGDGGT